MRAQIHAQVIVYILALIITSMILVFGYKAVVELNARGEQTALIKFQSELSKDIKALKYDFGSVRKKTYDVPGDFQEVCFVDISNINPSNLGGYPLIQDSVQDNVQKDVFLLPPGTESFFIGNLSMGSDEFICKVVHSGRLDITIEGMGRSVKVS